MFLKTTIFTFLFIVGIITVKAQEPIVILESTNPVAVDGFINICQGETVTFNATADFQGGSGDGAIYIWNLVETVLEGQTVNYTYNNAGVYSVLLQVVADAGSSTIIEVLTVQVANSPVVVFTENGNSPYCPGDFIEVTANATLPVDCDPSINETALLPDGNGTSYEFCIPVFCFEPDAVITSVNDILAVCINLEHSYLGDLDIDLVAPDGTTIRLQEQGGGSANLGIPYANGDSDTNSSNTTPGLGYPYCFRPNLFFTLTDGVQSNGTFPINDGPETYTDDYVQGGDYGSFESFFNLVGVPLNGDWCVVITDNISFDNGYIFGVDIYFDSDLYSDNLPESTNSVISESWLDAPNILTNNGETITVASNNEGEFCFTYVVEDDFGCTYTEEHCVTVENFTSIAPNDLFLCDEDNDGVAAFDLTINDVPLSDGNPDFIISYHETEADALNNINALLSPYINIVPFNQTLYSRVASPTNETCFDVQSFMLAVFETPQINNPDPIRLCDDDGDGIEIFDLTQVETQLLDGLTGGPYITQYFETESNAENNVNRIVNTQNYPNQPPLGNPQTIFIRVTNTVTGCFSFETVLLYIDTLPELGIPNDLFIEEENSDGFAIFDLSINDSVIVNGDPDLVVLYFETEADAQNFINPIIPASSYVNIINPQTIFANVQNVDTNCLGSVQNFNIEVLNILGVTDFNFGNMTLVPNPATNEVMVSWSENTTVAVVNLYSIRGKLLLSNTDVQNISETFIALSDLATGVYFVELISQEGVISTQKLLKK